MKYEYLEEARVSNVFQSRLQGISVSVFTLIRNRRCFTLRFFFEERFEECTFIERISRTKQRNYFS